MSPSTGRAWRRVAVLSALVGPGLLVPGGAPTSSAALPVVDRECSQVINGEHGSWSVRQAPHFGVGDQQVAGHAPASEAAPELVTNGVAILTSPDGCTWSEAFRLPESPSPTLPASYDTDRILELVVHPRSPDLAWAVVAVGQDVADRVGIGVPLTPAGDEGRDPTQTVVLHSEDGGTSWQPTGTPLLPGTPGQLATAPSDPDRLYLPTSAGLMTSPDRGDRWVPTGPGATGPAAGGKPLDAITSPVLTGVAVDPEDPATLYGRTSTAVLSHDGGTTWASYGLPPGTVAGPFVDAGGHGRLLFSQQPSSTDPVESLWLGARASGLTRVPVGPGSLDGAPWRAAWSPVLDEMLMATWDRNFAAGFPDTSIYRIDGAGRIDDVNDLDLPFVRSVLVDPRGTYHLATRHELVTFTPAELGEAPPPEQEVEVAPFGDVDPAPPEPATLSGVGRVEVEPGEEVPLAVELDLPRHPSPLDLYFLLDTSNSFEPDIQAVAESMGDVVRHLSRDRIDVQVGLGELGTQEARRYRRHADVARPGTELQRGFESLRIGGSVESHLIALHQTATGAGITGTSGPPVAPGQAPSWRRGSLRTVVLVTDVEYSDEDDPEAPSRTEVYRALTARGIQVIGVEVVREGGDDGVPGSYAGVEGADAASTTFPTPARRDLEELARATGTLAPPGGVDCRGNGTTELHEGDPLVCTTTALHVADLSTMSGVLDRVLAAQVDRRTVTLRARGAAQVRPTVPSGWRLPGVDVRRDQAGLTFAGTVGCTTAQEGRRLPTTLEALVAGRLVATTHLDVVCGEPGSPVEPPGGPEGVDTNPAAPDARQVPPVQPVTGTQGAGVPLPLPPGTPAVLTGHSPATGSAPGTSPATSPGGSPGTTPGTAVADSEEDAAELAVAWLPMTAGSMTAVTAGLLLHRRRHETTPRLARNRR